MGVNIGGGQEIKLRIRRPNNEWDFFPYEQILDTMLHELCHIVHGPHNADFYSLLDELRKVILWFLSSLVKAIMFLVDWFSKCVNYFNYLIQLKELFPYSLALTSK